MTTSMNEQMALNAMIINIMQRDHAGLDAAIEVAREETKLRADRHEAKIKSGTDRLAFRNLFWETFETLVGYLREQIEDARTLVRLADEEADRV